MARTPVARRRSASTETISVEVRPLFGEVKTFSAPEGATVKDLLTQGGFNASSEIRLIPGNGGAPEILQSDSILEDGDVLQIVSGKKITNG